METKIEKIQEDFGRDTYWTRIHFESKDGKESVVLVCASLEYFWDLFVTRNFDETQTTQWFERVAEKWKSHGDNIFNKKVHYDSYATTAEAKQTGLIFLEEEVTP